MRTLLYLSSVVLALPGIALAAAFLVLGSAIATHSLIGFLGVLLGTAVALLPWGLLAIAAALAALVLAGLSTRVRWLASLCVAALAIASSAVAIALIVAHGNGSVGQLAFFVPGAVSAVTGIWLAVRERPGAVARAARPDDASAERAPQRLR
jgi:hypothetical protein